MKHRNWVVLLIVLTAILLGFNIYGAYKQQTAIRPVPCLDPEVMLQQHQHATLQIVVDGVLEKVSADIGASETCHFALHTHDDTGTLHVEAQDIYPYTLGDFFRVWQKPIQRKEYSLTVFVNSSPYEKNPEKIILVDKQQIILSYLRE